MQDWGWKEAHDSEQDDLMIEVKFGRKLMSEILTTFLPTTLICMVSFSTNYYKSQFFEALVAVNLTSLLVLTTLFVSVSNALPKTSYIKMIDIWLIFTLMIPYSEVILHTMIAALRYDDEFAEKSNRVGVIAMINMNKIKPAKPKGKVNKDEKLANTLDNIAKFGIPIMYTLFVLLYFLAGHVLVNL